MNIDDIEKLKKKIYGKSIKSNTSWSQITMSLKSVARMPLVQNVCVMILVRTQAGIRILTTEERRFNQKTGQRYTTMGFPGGKVDTNPTTRQPERAWDAVRREYGEETKFAFPAISFPGAPEFLRFVWTNSNGVTTGIYVGFTTEQIPISSFVPNGEIADLHLTLVADIVAAISGQRTFTVRHCAKASTIAVFQALGWA